MEEIMNTVSTYLLTYGFRVLAALVILFVGRWIVDLLTKIISSLLDKARFDRTLSSFIQHLITMAGMAFVIIAAVNKLGVETTSIVAVVGAAGLAVGLALQGSLANFAAGVLLIIFKPFKVGDCIQLGSEVGIVQSLQIFNTVVHTLDNRRLILPNSKITDDVIVNLTAVDKRRVDLTFSISYSDDIKKAKEALREVLEKDERIIKETKPVIAVCELAESSVNIVCRPWVKPHHYREVLFDVLEEGKYALERAGMTIPFPQRDIHIYQEEKK